MASHAIQWTTWNGFYSWFGQYLLFLDSQRGWRCTWCSRKRGRGKLVSLVYWIVLLNVVVMAVGGLVPLKSISTDVVTHSLTHSAALFQFRVSKILLSLCR